MQRVVEEAGISTTGITIVRHFTEEVRPPRAVFLPWPMGHPLGGVGNAWEQRMVLKRTLLTLEEIKDPPVIVDLPFKWGETTNADPGK